MKAFVWMIALALAQLSLAWLVFHRSSFAIPANVAFYFAVMLVWVSGAQERRALQDELEAERRRFLHPPVWIEERLERIETSLRAAVAGETKP